MVITAFLSRSPGLLNREPGGQASLEHGLHFSIFSPTNLISNWSELQLLNRGPEGLLCWVLVFSTASYLQLIWTSCRQSPGLYNILTSTLLPASVTILQLVQPHDSQGHILIFLDRMHQLFAQVHFLFWQLGRVGGQYTTYLFAFFDFYSAVRQISKIH